MKLLLMSSGSYLWNYKHYMCWFFFYNFNGNKKDLCILQRLILIVPEEPLEHDGKIKSRDFPIFESREVNITFQGLL
jgi:hypothetical protein